MALQEVATDDAAAVSALRSSRRVFLRHRSSSADSHGSCDSGSSHGSGGTPERAFPEEDDAAASARGPTLLSEEERRALQARRRRRRQLGQLRRSESDSTQERFGLQTVREDACLRPEDIPVAQPRRRGLRPGLTPLERTESIRPRDLRNLITANLSPEELEQFEHNQIEARRLVRRSLTRGENSNGSISSASTSSISSSSDDDDDDDDDDNDDNAGEGTGKIPKVSRALWLRRQLLAPRRARSVQGRSASSHGDNALFDQQNESESSSTDGDSDTEGDSPRPRSSSGSRRSGLASLFRNMLTPNGPERGPHAGPSSPSPRGSRAHSSSSSSSSSSSQQEPHQQEPHHQVPAELSVVGSSDGSLHRPRANIEGLL